MCAHPYRGVQFGLLSLDEGKTKWTIYPKKENGAVQTGVVDGGSDAAEAACRKAIDAWFVTVKQN
jgi:hypothetical protein